MEKNCVKLPCVYWGRPGCLYSYCPRLVLITLEFCKIVKHVINRKFAMAEFSGSGTDGTLHALPCFPTVAIVTVEDINK